MGVLNVTPDSFSDGGQFSDSDAAVDHAFRLVEDGAGIIDVGGESTRPGADPVPEETELARVLPVIEKIAGRTSAEISIDTRKPGVASACIQAGASIWNDVSGLTFAEDSVEVAAALSCKVIVMHAQGDPRTMQDNPHYDDVVSEVLAWLAGRIEVCVGAGVSRYNLIADPGIGFGKTLDHNLALMRVLERFQALDVPILLGASRKRFIAALDRQGPADARLGGSIAAALSGAARGAAILRVHDVAETRQALKIAAAVNNWPMAKSPAGG